MRLLCHNQKNTIMAKTILITGATDGLGKALSLSLAKEGHHLLVHGRNQDKVNELVKQLMSLNNSSRITPYLADYSSLENVRKMSSEISSHEGHLDVLVNNAGIGAGTGDEEKQLSEDGYELRFAVNYLSSFHLTRALLPLLKKSATKSNDVRIVNMASAGQRKISFRDVMLDNGYSGINAYSQSKLALIMFSFDLANELCSFGITVNALHPATLMPTKMTLETFGYGIASIEDGAKATKRLVTHQSLKKVTGKYFDGHRIARANDQAYNESEREKLKDLSFELITQSMATGKI